ncbi:MAG: Cof-type HAD-IIB family hydrolase [Muribaculaceae bacterium]|nr:Cof-type HAD-IIB family hydrolase [Muribaculaceae bacterium]
MKTLYVTDLDGTLLAPDGRLSDASAEMLNKAISGGALFSIATARTPSTVETLLKKVHTNLPFIVMTGAAGWNPTDGLFSHTVSIPRNDAEQILEVFRKHSLPVFIYCFVGGVIHVYHSGSLSEPEKEFMKGRSGRYKQFHVPDDGQSTLPSPLPDVALFYSIQPSEEGKEAYEELKRGNICNPLFYNDIYGERMAVLEAFAPEASKANALKWLKKVAGADRVVVFGDNVNDIPMLRAADVAVAVENALPEVKEMADIIIGPNYSDSVAQYILTDSQLSSHAI